jgi:hypothetical protein
MKNKEAQKPQDEQNKSERKKCGHSEILPGSAYEASSLVLK